MEANSIEPQYECDPFDLLAGTALLDQEFRNRLFANPAEAAAELEITLTQEQIDHIKSLDASLLNGLAQQIDEEIGFSTIASWTALQDPGQLPL
jgi:hypothetical protein